MQRKGNAPAARETACDSSQAGPRDDARKARETKEERRWSGRARAREGPTHGATRGEREGERRAWRRPRDGDGRTYGCIVPPSFVIASKAFEILIAAWQARQPISLAHLTGSFAQSPTSFAAFFCRSWTSSE